MTPQPDKPKIVILIDIDPLKGTNYVKEIASNISPNVEVVFTGTKNDFQREAAGQMFDTTRKMKG